MTFKFPNNVEEKASVRISGLELMRFVSALGIVCLHYNYIFINGYIFVEFFFILTGLLMAQSAHKSLLVESTTDIGNETKRFILKKIKPLIPYLIIGFVAMIAAYLINDGNSLTIDMINNQIPGYLLLSDAGFNVESPIMLDVAWYISAMVIGLMILYPLYLLCKKTSDIVMVLLFIFIIGYLNNIGDLNLWRQWGGWICLGLLRGIGEMALGAFCYTLCGYIKQKDLTTVAKALYTLLIPILVAILLLWSAGVLEKTKDFVIIFIIASIIILIYCEKGFKTPAIDKMCQYLGVLSLPIFLLHRPIQVAVLNYYGTEWFTSNIILVIALVITTSTIIVYIQSKIRKFFKLSEIKHRNTKKVGTFQHHGYLLNSMFLS